MHTQPCFKWVANISEYTENWAEATAMTTDVTNQYLVLSFFMCFMFSM